MGVIVIIWIICGIIGAAIGSGKGRGGEGFVLGLFLGVIGIVIIACMKPKVQLPPV